MWVPLGWFLQVFLLAEFLPNYTEQQGYFSIAWGLAQIVMLVGLFAESMLGGISESYHAKRKKLTQYYALNSLKWGAFFDFFFVAILLAIGPRFILGGAGQEWAGAAILIPWLLFFHAFGFLSWLGDWMFAGSDRPGWAAMSWIIEQGVRAVLLIIFIPQYAFFSKTFGSPLVAVMFAYIPALVIKDIYMWIAIRRSEYFKFKWKDLAYQGLITPLLTGFFVFILSEIICMVIWGGDIITSVIILLLGTFPMIYVASFIFSFLGGFDENTLAEFKRAAYMAKGVGFLARGLYWMAEKGAKISPLHNKFPISIYQLASDEANSLTAEKKVLVI
jgi:O-antigen/teichoic acid export membrane protein